MSTIQRPSASDHPARHYLSSIGGVAMRLGITAATLTGITGCSAAAANNAFTVNGQLSVAGEGGSSAGAECFPSDGYDDIAEGASVVVMDAAGKTVAIGKLGPGETGSYLLSCNFKFKVTGVPAGAKFYKVEVSHRGAVQYTEKQMHQTLDLSLG